RLFKFVGQVHFTENFSAALEHEMTKRGISKIHLTRKQSESLAALFGRGIKVGVVRDLDFPRQGMASDAVPNLRIAHDVSAELVPVCAPQSSATEKRGAPPEAPGRANAVTSPWPPSGRPQYPEGPSARRSTGAHTLANGTAARPINPRTR